MAHLICISKDHPIAAQTLPELDSARDKEEDVPSQVVTFYAAATSSFTVIRRG